MKVNGFVFSVIGICVLAVSGCKNTQGELKSATNSPKRYEARCPAEKLAEAFTKKHKPQALPISREEPRYPVAAARNRISGYVAMEYDVSAQGEPININVFESTPRKVFDSAAKKSLSKWRYKKGAPITCMVTRLNFSVGRPYQRGD